MNKILSSQKFHVVCIVLIVCVCLSSCRAVKVVEQVPVYLKDTVHDTHTEYVYRTDTVINNIETIVREANDGDSALLAQLGLQLKDNERTILVLRNELLQKIQQIEQSQTDSAYQHNETPVTISKTETVEVEKPLTWWQKLFIGVGVISLALCVSFVVLRIIKH